MTDRREEILDKYNEYVCDFGLAVGMDNARDAMDQYMEECVLEAIEYIGRNIKWMVEKDGEILFWNGREYLSKEQIFENFL